MDIAEKQQQLMEYKAELDDVHRRRSLLERREDALRQIVGGLEGLLAEEDAEPDEEDEIDAGASPSGPRGKAAVRTLLLEVGAMGFAEIIEQVKQRGWIKTGAKNPDHSIRVTLDRMTKDAEIVYDELGRIALAQSELPQPGGPI